MVGAEREPCAESRSAAENSPNQPADRAHAALTAREPLPGGELRPTEGTRCGKSHREDPDPGLDKTAAQGIRGMSADTGDGVAC